MPHHAIESQIAHFVAMEMSHRHANEFAAALAALHLVRARTGGDDPILGQAIARLEGNVNLERLLLHPPTNRVVDTLRTLCELMTATRTSAPTFAIRALGDGVMNRLDDHRLFLRVGYELLANAAKHQTEGGPRIRVGLVIGRRGLRLTVSNHSRAPIPQGDERSMGLLIVRRLAGLVGGRLSARWENGRFVTTAVFPNGDAAPADEPMRRTAWG